ncbi:MAG TPA: hypothetical protein VEI49_08615 [Terriglobales bacterium]|nr:hypothetical protein [Terriglobales bacterium]
MKRVTGIGRVFFISEDPEQLHEMVRETFGDMRGASRAMRWVSLARE